MTDGLPQRAWKVLVVDDEVDLLTLVRLTLQFEDDPIVVTTAATPAEAVVVTRELHPDLVILDHLLGGPMTGLQMVGALRTASPGTRVIIFSAAKEVIDLRDHDEGVDAVVAKMDIGELPAVIRRVLATDPS